MCPGFWTETMFDIFALVWRKDNYSSAISKIYKRQLFIYICIFLSVRILEYLNTLALKQQNINVTIMSNISFYNIRDQSLKAVPFILVEPFFCFYTACLSSLCIHILFNLVTRPLIIMWQITKTTKNRKCWILCDERKLVNFHKTILHFKSQWLYYMYMASLQTLPRHWQMSSAVCFLFLMDRWHQLHPPSSSRWHCHTLTLRNLSVVTLVPVTIP